MKKFFVCLVAVMAMLLGVSSCKPSLPSDVLSKGKMTDILYDYHLALAMARTDDNGDQGQGLAYREAVLRKHDVTSAEFDSSMVYYMRHTEMMEDVYKDLTERLGNEITAMGGNANAGGVFANLSATGDTANVWNLATSMVFMPMKPYNSASFEIKADSAFHKGDRLMLDFDAQFIFQDGVRDGIAMLAVQFDNDSIAQSYTHIQGSQHYTVELTDMQSLGIKSVRGYFLLSGNDSGSSMSSQTTLKLMFLEHIKLVRMHQQKSTPAPSPASESATTATSDSLKKDSDQTFSIPADKPQKPLRPMKMEPIKTR